MKNNSTLENHEERIRALEEILKKRGIKQIKNASKTLSGVLLDLRNAGFFSETKTSEETHEQLQKKYPCEINRVEVALFRMSRRKQLRVASKVVLGKKKKAFVW